MSIEALIWRYEQGESSSFPLEDVLEVFRPFIDSFDSDSGVLCTRFGEPFVDACDIYLGSDSAINGTVKGLMISRPIRDTRLWECVLSIMRTGNVILFFTDDSTPLYATPGAPSHFPQDLIDSLGEPKLVSSPQDIIDSHER